MSRFLYIFLFISTLAYGQNAPQLYFQQRTDVKMEVTLDDSLHTLRGNIEIRYTNNSADTLPLIWFHLWPNAYKNNRTAMAKQLIDQGNTWFRFARAEDRGYIDSLRFSVDGQAAVFQLDKQNIDIGKLTLPVPLAPGSSVTIRTPFYVKLPSAKISRLGHLKNDYYITQWYPKPAVYDKEGWHPMPYLTQGEFYSEYGDYEVSITVPKEYVVAATGELQNETEKDWLLGRAAWSEKMKEAHPRKLTWNFDTATGTKTLTYTAQNVHDFAWFADREVLVSYKPAELPSSKKVDTWSFYKWKNAETWADANDYIANTLKFYSEKTGEYPYSICTAYDGFNAAGGDMEYPTLTLIGNAGGPYGLESVIVHEVGHNWFYGIFGSNEREHAWMDEGINSFYERLYFDRRYPDEKIWMYPEFLGIMELPERLTSYYDYLYEARENLDQPIELSSEKFTEENYAAIVYSKSTEVFYYLRAYLGDSIFDEAMQQYFRDWKFRHPYPSDLEAEFQQVTEKPVERVFSQLIGTKNKIQYTVKSVRFAEEGIYLAVKNNGNTDLDFPVRIRYKDASKDTLVWVEGFSGETEILLPGRTEKPERLWIDDGQIMPEVNRKDNSIRTSGVFRKLEKFRFQLFTSIENPFRTQLFFLPTVGWNDYNKAMFGIALYNKSLTPQKFEFALNPMFATGTATFAGNAEVSYQHFPKRGKLYKWKIQLPFSRFAYAADSIQNLNYIRLAPGITLEFKKKNPPGKFRHELDIRSLLVIRELPAGSNLDRPQFTTLVNRVQYTLSRNHALLPFYVKTTFEHITDFNINYILGPIEPGQRFKLSLEAWMKLVYYRKNKGISVRLFAGTFLDRNNSVGDYRFRMSGWAGYQDYTNSTYFVGRSETDGIWANQMAHADGDFKVFSFIGQTQEWLVALNFKAELPVIPVAFYFDIGTYANAGNAFPGSQLFVFNGGVCIDVWPGIAEVYFPLFMSKDIQNSVELNTSTYWERIRFVINLKKLDPFEHGRRYFR